MFVFNPKTTFPHHAETLVAYLKLEFPDVTFSMFNENTLLVGDASNYQHLPIRWKHTGDRESGSLVNYILGFVSGDPNDTFCMEERILDHGWYETVVIS